MALNQPASSVATTTVSERPAGPIAPTASRMLPLLVIAPVVTAAVRWGRPHYLETSSSAAALTLLLVVVFGFPALFWALDHGRLHFRHLAILGAAAGVLSPIAILVAGVLGQFAHGDLAYVRQVLEQGSPLPWYGILRWPRFAGMTAASAIAGVATGAVYWLLFVRPGPSLLVSLLISAGIVAAGAGLSMLLP